MRKWLMNDLSVPKHQIALLLNEKATKQNIEHTLNTHLLHNNQIQASNSSPRRTEYTLTRLQEGDGILIYFAGHGSSLKAPHESRPFEVLCPWDHDTKGPEGRVAGISARALSKFLTDLSKSKGNNVTLMLDSCFTSPPPRSRDRSSIRWTSTNKAVVDDLYHGQLACPKRQKRNEGFCSRNWTTHTVITACKPGATATEGKEGGRFTSSFLEVMRSTPLHSTSFTTLMEKINLKMGESQSPHYSGLVNDRLFNAIPFIEDLRYIPVQFHSEKGIRIELGSLHGIEKGAELSLHPHNYVGSCNPAIATVTIHDVHPTWCAGRPKTSFFPRRCWARVPLHNHGLSYARLKKAVQAFLHSTVAHKSSFSSRPVSRSVSISDFKGTTGKSELIETADASKTLLVPFLK